MRSQRRIKNDGLTFKEVLAAAVVITIIGYCMKCFLTTAGNLPY